MSGRLARWWFRAWGVLLLLIGVLALHMYSLNECHPDPTPPHAGLRATFFVAATTAIGYGLLFLRKWAAAAFAVASTAFGTWVILHDVPPTHQAENAAIGAALIFSAAIVIWHWPLLSWGPRRLG